MPANGLFGAFEQRSPYVGDNFRSIFLACIIHYRSSLSVHVRFIHWHQSPSDGLDLGRLNHEKQRGLVLPEPYEQPIANPKALLVNEILPDSILTPMCWIATDLGSSLRQRRKSYVTLPLRSAVDVVSDLYVSAIDGWRFCRLLRSMSCTGFQRYSDCLGVGDISGNRFRRSKRSDRRQRISFRSRFRQFSLDRVGVMSLTRKLKHRSVHPETASSVAEVALPFLCLMRKSSCFFRLFSRPGFGAAVL